MSVCFGSAFHVFPNNYIRKVHVFGGCFAVRTKSILKHRMKICILIFHCCRVQYSFLIAVVHIINICGNVES